MEILVVADAHLFRDKDGVYWAKSIYGYDFWKRYLTVFDSVAVVSRTKQVDSIENKNYLRVDGPRVRVIELPFLRGMKEYFKSYFELKKAAKAAIKDASCAVFRLPSVVSSIVLDFYKETGLPYSIEIVADPQDAYSSNKVAQIYYSKRLKQDALHANGVSYVTKDYLQSKYPSRARLAGETKENFETYYSSIDLKESYFSQPKKYSTKNNKYTIVHTANSINNGLKGHETVIKIIKKLRDKDYNINAIFIGDGDKKEYYEKLAKSYGISQHINFIGLLSSSNDVREILLDGDLFIFPSKAEGLPRVVIEAMAVGLPCLSTPVNGIPELLDNEYLFSPDDVDGFSIKIIELINNPHELEKMSIKNIEKAKEYTEEKLSIRRNLFYRKLKLLVNLRDEDHITV